MGALVRRPLWSEPNLKGGATLSSIVILLWQSQTDFFNLIRDINGLMIVGDIFDKTNFFLLRWKSPNFIASQFKLFPFLASALFEFDKAFFD
ncbi:MAG: hypothetical protein IV090_01330 [Candidatus Sericytochromatia bacterium]|nr:hypothetical protein [Candidatus Sericytochromatia bacterium]